VRGRRQPPGGRPATFARAPLIQRYLDLTDLCKALAGSDRQVGAAWFDVSDLVSKLE